MKTFTVLCLLLISQTTSFGMTKDEDILGSDNNKSNRYLNNQKDTPENKASALEFLVQQHQQSLSLKVSPKKSAKSYKNFEKD